MTLSDLFFKRQAAEATLSDPGIVAAFADVRQAAHLIFAESKPFDIEEREDAYYMLRGLDALEVSLQNRITAHKYAEQQSLTSVERHARAELRRA